MRIFAVVLVGDVADQLLEQVLHRHQPETEPYSSVTTAMWNVPALHLRQELADALRLRHELDRAHQLLDRHLVRP